MTDLTKLTTPFGLLDKETKAALKASDGPIEAYLQYSGFGKWIEMRTPVWADVTVYRVKPAPVVETLSESARCHLPRHEFPTLYNIPSEMGVVGTYTLTLEDGKPVKLVWEAE